MGDSRQSRDFLVLKTCDNSTHDLLMDLASQVGDKWTLNVLGAIARSSSRRTRFSELNRRVKGISQRMLTSTLRKLERDGFVERTVFPEVPPRVEYSLTDLGKSFVEQMREMVQWTAENAATIASAREGFKARGSSALKGDTSS